MKVIFKLLLRLWLLLYFRFHLLLWIIHAGLLWWDELYKIYFLVFWQILCYTVFLLWEMKKDPSFLLVWWVIPQVTRFCVSVDSRYVSIFKYNYSGCMVAFTIHFSGREVLILLCNLKIGFLPSYPLKHHQDLLGRLSLLYKRMPLALGYPHIGYSILLCLLVTALLGNLQSYKWRVFLIQST